MAAVGTMRASLLAIALLSAVIPAPSSANFIFDSDPLYDDSDPIVRLNVSNFNKTVLATDNAWIVEFYNSWCGHCVNFAPVWKALAKDVRAWKRVITVAVVECSVKANVPLCRKYEVASYPTIKFFRVFSTADHIGVLRSGNKSEEKIRQSMIDFVESQAEEVLPSHWPDLTPTKKSSVSDLWMNVPEQIKAIAVVVEGNNSYTGREVILDMVEAKSNSLLLTRTLSDNVNLLKALNVTSLPALVVVLRNFTVQHYVQPQVNRASFRDFLINFAGKMDAEWKKEEAEAGEEGQGAGDKPDDDDLKGFGPEMEEGQTSVDDSIYMQDLENAVYYSLNQEVALHKEIKGESLDALKAFLRILVKYFPGRKSVMEFLNKLDQWLQDKVLTNAETMLEFMESIKSSNVFLPPMQPWMSCRGSQSRYRGYPCSLWVLFHTLTVEAYNKRDSVSSFNPMEVLKGILGFIKFFFSCQQCSQHFQEMASSLASDVQQPADCVLWLWQAHNKVNARLRGDLTEDPFHPKVQFPSQDMCSSCQLVTEDGGGSQWDLQEVLAFLRSRYSKAYIISTALDLAVNSSEGKGRDSNLHMSKKRRGIERQKKQEAMEDPAGYPHTPAVAKIRAVADETNLSVNHTQMMSGSWGFSVIDMSLCVMLYVCSAAILLMVYFVVIVKRRLRRKMFHQKHMHVMSYA